MIIWWKSFFGKKRIKVEILCPHGEFIPGSFYYGRKYPTTYSCSACGFKVRLTGFRGPITW